MPNVEQAVLTAVREIVVRKKPGLETIERSHRLIADLGLDSMDIAELVAMLEVELGADPFAETASIADVHQVGDLIAVYERQLR